MDYVLHLIQYYKHSIPLFDVLGACQLVSLLLSVTAEGLLLLACFSVRAFNLRLVLLLLPLKA